MSIPLDPEGYSVNVETGTIHTRYSTHDGRHTRTRTAKGATYLLNGKQGTACATCYPYPTYPLGAKPRKPQVRRTPKAYAAPLPGK